MIKPSSEFLRSVTSISTSHTDSVVEEMWQSLATALYRESSGQSMRGVQGGPGFLLVLVAKQ